MIHTVTGNQIEFHHGPDELVVHLHRTLRLGVILPGPGVKEGSEWK